LGKIQLQRRNKKEKEFMNDNNIITKKEDYEAVKEAASISVKILKEVKDNLEIGKTAKNLDDLVVELCKKYDVKPAFKGQPGILDPFPGNICISTNDEILHAIPKKGRVFKSGDIVKLDFGIIHKGFYTDHCITVGLGELAPDEKRLIETAKLCIDKAVEKAVIGNRVGDISNVLESITELADFKFVTTYCGHGIGKSLHLSPEIPSYGYPGSGLELKKGMVICVENQITIGSADLKMDSDGWTLKTIDGSKGAMFEHMVYIGENGPEILTLL
jgi:methionyl aminopeptidase